MRYAAPVVRDREYSGGLGRLKCSEHRVWAHRAEARPVSPGIPQVRGAQPPESEQAMRRNLLAVMAVLALTVAISGAGTVVAQDGQGQGGQGQGRGQGQGQERRQQFDPEEMRQRMMDNLRERLGASDEDWQALEPKVQRVLEAQQQARAGGMGMGALIGGGRRGGGQGGGPGGEGRGEQDQSEIGVAARELRTALEDEATEGAVIAQRLEAFRAARGKAEQELAAAREDLKGLVTPRQEAMLVMMSLLE